MSSLIIAIDGPSASGKSTLGRLLARALGLLYVDTGSMYRAVALAVIEQRSDPSDSERVTKLAENLDIDLEGDPDSLKVLLDGRDVSDLIRTEQVTEVSSVVSTIPGVRRAMVARQREIAKRGSVMNGRDIGTVVFPNADLKFFLTADAEERARRRFNEWRDVNGTADYQEILTDLIERDRRDSTRTDSPLKVASDAIIIESTGKSIDEVFAEMMKMIEERGRGEEGKRGKGNS
jgi:cytidylate kinase